MGDRQTKTSPIAPALSQNAHPNICPSICARAAEELKWSALGLGGAVDLSANVCARGGLNVWMSLWLRAHVCVCVRVSLLSVNCVGS